MEENEKVQPVQELSYNQCMAQLEEIMRAMQSSSCDVDRLAWYTRRASELIASCRKRLTATQEEITAILEELKG